MYFIQALFLTLFECLFGGNRRYPDRMVVGFTTTRAISAYHHESCEFEFRYYVIKFVRDLRQVGGFLRAVPDVDKERP